jgi:hypothetical protein
MNKYVEIISLCFYIICDLLIWLYGRYLGKAYVVCVWCILFNSARSIQNPKAQRKYVETLCIPVRSTAFQSSLHKLRASKCYDKNSDVIATFHTPHR